MSLVLGGSVFPPHLADPARSSLTSTELSCSWRGDGFVLAIEIKTKVGAYSERPFFLLLKLSYVLFILARDHLGKLVFAGDGKISFKICSTQFPTYFFLKYVQHISLTYFGFFFWCT